MSQKRQGPTRQHLQIQLSEVKQTQYVDENTTIVYIYLVQNLLKGQILDCYVAVNTAGTNVLL